MWRTQWTGRQPIRALTNFCIKVILLLGSNICIRTTYPFYISSCRKISQQMLWQRGHTEPPQPPPQWYLFKKNKTKKQTNIRDSHWPFTDTPPKRFMVWINVQCEWISDIICFWPGKSDFVNIHLSQCNKKSCMHLPQTWTRARFVLDLLALRVGGWCAVPHFLFILCTPS